MRKLTSAEQTFIERLGQQSQTDGISKIAGQIWAALIVSDGPVSSAELMEMLHISKGSVSTNTRLLEMLNIVERRSKPGERQDYFAIRDNPYSSLVEGQIKRFEAAIAVVDEAKKGITKKHACSNLDDLGRFYALFHSSSRTLLEALQSSAQDSGD